MSPRIAKFQWDEANLEHIALHDMTRADVEEAFRDPFAMSEDNVYRKGEVRFRMIGSIGGRLGNFGSVCDSQGRDSSGHSSSGEGTKVVGLYGWEVEMIEKIEMPDFATGAEEAQWWFDHRDEHDARLLAAIKNGSARRVSDVLFEHGLTLEGLQEVAVPVRQEDVELARRQADGAGIDYREYLGNLLHEALTKQDAA